MVDDEENPAPTELDGPAPGDSQDGMESGPGELCLPQDVVATADDKDQKVAPEVGDEVRFDCVAKVTKVDGGNIYLSPTEVNGQPVGNEDKEEANEPAAENDDSMRAMAQSADDQNGGM